MLKADQKGRQPKREIGKRLEQTLYKRGYPKGRQAYKKVSNFISHLEIQIKTTM